MQKEAEELAAAEKQSMLKTFVEKQGMSTKGVNLNA